MPEMMGKMAKKRIDEVRIKPTDDGGHLVTHHYKDAQREGKHGVQSSYVEPESHVFGPKDGHEMLAHVANHLEIPEVEDPNEEKTETAETEKSEGRMTREKARRVTAA